MVETTGNELWNQDTKAPALIASHCKECGAKHFPGRRICNQCFNATLEKILLAQRGTVYAYCHVFFKKQDHDQAYYTTGYVLLEDGITVPARIVFKEQKPEVGLPVVLAAAVGGLSPEGQQMPGYYFLPEIKGV